MKKNFFLIGLSLSFSILIFSFTKREDKCPVAAPAVANQNLKADSTRLDSTDSVSLSLYKNLQLDRSGLSKEALSLALKGYEKLKEEGSVNNARYLTIVDLSQSSRNKRFYLLDVKDPKLVVNTFVAHGRNSGVDEANCFSNEPNSEESSLGFYLTENTYKGKHGLSLRLEGLEEGFNDNAEARGIVVHGASYVNKNRVETDYMGRSQGCPALPQNEYARVIRLIKDGSVLFVYHPSSEYLQESSLIKS